MSKSMTGYGKAVAQLSNGSLTVEIRTLNAKNADINLKSSLLPKDKELLLRQKIAQSLQRGTIDVFLSWEVDRSENSRTLNKELAFRYLSQLMDIARESGLQVDGPALMSCLVHLPELVDSGKAEIITEENYPLVEAAFDDCLEQVNRYRSDEGRILYKDVTSRVQKILSLYDEVERLAPLRLQAIKERIQKAAADASVKLDAERFEQEMIFYLEKLDINEEKVRLRQHCNYFMQTIDTDPLAGKKLGFIIQEMGREINTTGSKANDADIQRLVVQMKDELEKIREQSMNIL